MIYVARIGFAVSVAGMFTCSIVHIQNLVPANRRTEVIGNLGSSGFLGMILGTQAGDLIFAAFPSGRPQFVALFSGTVLLGLIYLFLVVWLTRSDTHLRPHSTPPAHRLLIRYWPGNVLLVAIMMGVSLTVTTVFLTRFATHLGLKNGVGTFFTAYALFAFVFRLSTRNWSYTIGRHRMILLGLSGHAVGHALLPFVTKEWHFLIPAVICGFGHALLFPAVVSLGADRFPEKFRGSGTALVLGFVDLGTALFAPLLGAVIDYFDHTGFTQMFYTSTATATIIAVVYALTTARKSDAEFDVESPDDSAADSLPAPLPQREPVSDPPSPIPAPLLLRTRPKDAVEISREPVATTQQPFADATAPNQKIPAKSRGCSLLDG